MGSNNSSETNIINNSQVRVFSEGLPAYELDRMQKEFGSLDWKMMARQDNWRVM